MTSHELILLNFSEDKKIIKRPLNMATPRASKKKGGGNVANKSNKHFLKNATITFHVKNFISLVHSSKISRYIKTFNL